MDAVLATIAMATLMVIVLALVARSWPRSSGLGGYRARGDTSGPGAPPVREDDDAHWRWEPEQPAGDSPSQEE